MQVTSLLDVKCSLSDCIYAFLEYCDVSACMASVVYVVCAQLFQVG